MALTFCFVQVEVEFLKNVQVLISGVVSLTSCIINRIDATGYCESVFEGRVPRNMQIYSCFQRPGTCYAILSISKCTKIRNFAVQNMYANIFCSIFLNIFISFIKQLGKFNFSSTV